MCVETPIGKLIFGEWRLETGVHLFDDRLQGMHALHQRYGERRCLFALHAIPESAGHEVGLALIGRYQALAVLFQEQRNVEVILRSGSGTGSDNTRDSGGRVVAIGLQLGGLGHLPVLEGRWG